jgi:hypothetical protein
VLKRLDHGIGEGSWGDPSVVADDVQIQFSLAAGTVAWPTAGETQTLINTHRGRLFMRTDMRIASLTRRSDHRRPRPSPPTTSASTTGTPFRCSRSTT